MGCVYILYTAAYLVSHKIQEKTMHFTLSSGLISTRRGKHMLGMSCLNKFN